MNVTALCPPGLKSHCVGLLLRKENGKCDAAKHGAEFPNIGSHSPKQYVNQGGLSKMRHTNTGWKLEQEDDCWGGYGQDGCESSLV